MCRILPYRIVCLSTMILMGLQVHAQTPGRNFETILDSLKSLAGNSLDDSAHIKLFGQITWEYILDGDYDLAWQYADSIQSISAKSGNETGMALAHFYYGVVSRHKGDYSKALDHLDHYISNQRKSGDSTKVAAGLFQLGVVHQLLGNLEKSLAIYYRLMAIHEANQYDYGIGFTLNTIGSVYRRMGKHADAEHAYTRAIGIFENLDKPIDKADALNNLANLYVDRNEVEKAIPLYRQTLEIDQAAGYEQGVAYGWENLGNAYNKLHRYDTALVYQLKAFDIRRNLPKKNELAISLKQVGHTYLLLKDFVRAERFLLDGLELGREIQVKPLVRDNHELLARLYAAMGLFSKAYAHQESYMLVKDSIIDENTAIRLNELQAKYEAEKKDQLITLLAQEKSMQELEAQRQATLKTAFILVTILISLVALLLVYGQRQRLKNQKALFLKDEEIKSANFRQQLADLEKKALQAQINPHFTFNCLNSINQLILKGNNDQASLYLTKFSKLIRLQLENADVTEVSLTDEISLLESYIQLEGLRFRDRIDYTIQLVGAVDPEGVYLPPMILQPFVENAIWHGLLHKGQEKPATLHLLIKVMDDRLHCTIEDNGVGRKRSLEIKQESVFKTRSLGMKITEDRLKLLNRESKQKFIQVEDLHDENGNALGTRVEVNIPTTY